MTQAPSAETVLGQFDTTLYAGAQRWTLSREGDSFAATRTGPDGASQEARVALLTGSHHLQNYWMDVGQGWLVQLPFVWLIEEGRWIPAESSFLQPPDAPPTPVIWNDTCIYCHTVSGTRGAGSDAQETQSSVGELGIACEACHGPAEDHARSQRSPIRRYTGHLSDQGADEVVHPTRLKVPEQEAVCGQCHAVFMHRKPTERATEGDAFRPGDRLEQTRFVLELQGAPHPGHDAYLPPRVPTTASIRHRGGVVDAQVVGLTPSGLYVTASQTELGAVIVNLGGRESRGVWRAHMGEGPVWIDVGRWPPAAWRAALDAIGLTHLAVGVKDWDAFWRDGTIRTVGREQNGMTVSPCAVKGDMTCMTCHDMHGESPDKQMRPGFDGDQACAECHGDLVASPEAHSKHPPEAAGCYDCHLPYTTYGLLGAARSHRIDTPMPRWMDDRGRPNACNLCHLDRTVAWAEETLAEWRGDSPSSVDDNERVAAGPRWALAGDAAVRAITAWHLGWPKARATAKVDDWGAPILSVLLDDPYAAVRAIAGKSAAVGPDGVQLDYDFVGPPDARRAAAKALFAAWSARRRGPAQPSLLLGTDGTVDNGVRRVLAGRDNRPVTVAE